MIINEELVELLKCNHNNVNLVDTIGVDGILRCIDDYNTSTNEHRNYLTDNDSLSNWYGDGFIYPNVSEYMKPVLDTVRNYKPYTILEAGSGSGKLSKMVYDVMDGDVDLHCIENNTEHYNQMLKNFNELIYEPKRIINAKTYLSSIDNMTELFEDNKFNLTYTHTVMMHIPYISAILSAKELARVTKDYILHVENKNDITNSVYPVGRIPEYNKLVIDYEKLYSKLGFDTVKYDEIYFKPENDSVGFNLIIYLGKKVNKTDKKK